MTSEAQKASRKSANQKGGKQENTASVGGVEIQTDMKHALLYELHATTLGNKTTTAKCVSEFHKRKPVEAKETDTTTQEAIELLENEKIRENPNVAFTRHMMTGKEPIGLG